jgi:hypothetical protein
MSDLILDSGYLDYDWVGVYGSTGTGSTGYTGALGGSGIIEIYYLTPTTGIMPQPQPPLQPGYPTITLTAGGLEVPYNPNTLNIDNAIGERGTCSFQVWDQDHVLDSYSGTFLNGGETLLHTGTTQSPVDNDKIIFIGDVPDGIERNRVYYVVNSYLWGDPITLTWFRIALTQGGEAVAWTPGTTLNTTYYIVEPYEYDIGENLLLTVDSVPIWSGVIERINKQLPMGQNKILYTIRGVSWNYACDKRRVVSTYSTDVTAGLDAGYIVEDIITNYLKNEGISTGVISTGAALGNVVFNYVQPSKCLDVLAEQSGYIWQINPDKTLDFKPHDYESLSFSLGSTYIQHTNFQYVETNPKYRNTQHVIGGYAYTDVSTEVQYGDSTKQTFLMPYPLMKVPTVHVILAASTGHAEDVGILGVDSSQQWFWNKYSNIVSQSASNTPLAATERLKVMYTGGYKSAVTVYNYPEIAALQSVEGGSGIIEDVLSKGRETNYDENLVLGQAVLDKYSTMTNTFTFKTRVGGISPGKILNVTFPDFSLSSEEMLVDSVSVKDEEGILWYSVSALTGPEHGGWSKFFDDFITKTIEKDIWANTEGDIVSVTTSFSETFTWTESVTESVFSCPLPCADTSTDTWNIYPNIADEARVSTGVAGYPC